MQAGNYNHEEYMKMLFEKAKKNQKEVTSGDAPGNPEEGLVIPDVNRKAYDWLKKEYDKNKHEVKVEMTSAKFEPGYSTEGAKDFKPGVYSSSQTSQSYKKENGEKSKKKQNIEVKFNKK